MKFLTICGALLLLGVAPADNRKSGLDKAQGGRESNSAAQAAKSRQAKGNTLAVAYGWASKQKPAQPAEVLVTLFQHGKRIRSRQLSVGKGVDWKGLPDGEYEVHCSQIGYARSVYRILVSEKDVQTLTVRIAKDASRPVGGGPSYDDLVAALSKTRKSVAALQQRTRKLEATIAALKKALMEE